MRRPLFQAILTSSWRWLMRRLAALAMPALAGLAMQSPARAAELGATLYGPLRYGMTQSQVEAALDDKLGCRAKPTSENYIACNTVRKYLLAGAIDVPLGLSFSQNGLQRVSVSYEYNECRKFSLKTQYHQWKECADRNHPVVAGWFRLVVRHLQAVTGLQPVSQEGYVYFYGKDRTIWGGMALPAEFGFTFEPTP
jgi:hypothetical protein